MRQVFGTDGIYPVYAPIGPLRPDIGKQKKRGKKYYYEEIPIRHETNLNTIN
jgi:hypothetical protein